MFITILSFSAVTYRVNSLKINNHAKIIKKSTFKLKIVPLKKKKT